MIKKLGKSIYKVEHKYNHKTAAVKVIPIKETYSSDSQLDELVLEQLLQRCKRGKNYIPLYEHFYEKN